MIFLIRLRFPATKSIADIKPLDIGINNIYSKISLAKLAVKNVQKKVVLD